MCRQTIGFADDNTVVLGYARNDAALDAKIINLGKVDYIAVALSKGNTELLDAVNSSLVKCIKRNFSIRLLTRISSHTTAARSIKSTSRSMRFIACFKFRRI